MTETSPATDLETAISGVFQAPLDEFISRRDALAKLFRNEKRREDAAVVKALRKPSRMAWVLDAIAHEDPTSIDQLSAAIGDAQTGADLRSALEAVKEAVRAVAAVGARAAVRAGHPVEPNAVASAVHAVIGDANAFADFRIGRLVEVPEAGGLDLLTALTERPTPTRPVPASAPHAPVRESEPAKPDERRAQLAKSARDELRVAERALTSARTESERADDLVSNVEEKLEAAEAALEQAQADVKARRQELERAQREAKSATATLKEAGKAVDEARAQLAEFEES